LLIKPFYSALRHRFHPLSLIQRQDATAWIAAKKNRISIKSYAAFLFPTKTLHNFKYDDIFFLLICQEQKMPKIPKSPNALNASNALKCPTLKIETAIPPMGLTGIQPFSSGFPLLRNEV
jgi:hypothetical protein